MRIETLARLELPLVWTLHDMWAFTGGCHYDGGCERFVSACGHCPILGSSRERDLSHWVSARNRRAWKRQNLTVVAPSRRLAGFAARSALLGRFRIGVIPNNLDLNRYRPIDRAIARSLIGVLPNRRIILFGAVRSTGDERKVFRELHAAMRQLANTGWRNSPALLVFGATAPSQPPDFGLQVQFLGVLHDDISLVALYSAADVFVASSRQKICRTQ